MSAILPNPTAPGLPVPGTYAPSGIVNGVDPYAQVELHPELKSKRALKGAAPRKDTQGGWFRVLVGDHIADGPPGCTCTDCVKSGGKNHRYIARAYNLKTGEALDDPDYTGDLVYSPTVDLCEQHNGWGLGANGRIPSVKFARLDAERMPGYSAQYTSDPSNAPPGPAPTLLNLEALSPDTLKALAQAHDIKLNGKGKKEELIALLREHGLG